MCVLFRFGYTHGMRRIAATLAVLALLFSALGLTNAEEG